MIYRFSDLLFDTRRRELSRDGTVIPLPKLSYRVLRVLVEAAPDLVTHSELIERAWDEKRIVTPENLAQRVMMLRQALGDDVKQPRYIEGLRGQGFRILPEVVKVEPPSGSSQTVRWRWLAGALLAVILALVLFMYWPGGSAPSQTEEPVSYAQQVPQEMDRQRGVSLAVLPFVNLSSDPENDYLGDGLSEEIINSLVRETRLPVVSRTSSFKYRGVAMDGRQIGKELGVSHLLEGSVRHAGETLRITAQLIDASSGLHLWSQQYDRAVEDLLSIQAEIASSVMEEIREQLGARGEDRIGQALGEVRPAPRMPVGGKAYDHYLKGLQHRNRMLPNEMQLAIQSFKQAVELDEDFYEGWRALVDTQLLALTFPLLQQVFAEAYDDIEAAVRQAQQRFPNDAFFRFVEGSMLAMNHYRWKDGLKIMEKALGRLMNDPDALTWAGSVYMLLHYQDLSRDVLERSYALNPDAPATRFHLSWIYYFENRQQDSMELMDVDGLDYFSAVNAATLSFMNYDKQAMDRYLRLARSFVDPDNTTIRSLESLLLSMQGNNEAAERIGDRLWDEMRERPVMVGWIARSDERNEEIYRIGVQQRQPILVFWALNHPLDDPAPWAADINLQDLRGESQRILSLLEGEQRAEIESREIAVPVSTLEQYAGEFGEGLQRIVFKVEDGRLYYQERYFDGAAVAIGEQTFASLVEPDVEFEFFRNDSGVVDLCIRKNGQLTHYAYRTKQPANSMPSR